MTVSSRWNDFFSHWTMVPFDGFGLSFCFLFFFFFLNNSTFGHFRTVVGKKLLLMHLSLKMSSAPRDLSGP